MHAKIRYERYSYHVPLAAESALGEPGGLESPNSLHHWDESDWKSFSARCLDSMRLTIRSV